MMKYVIIQPCPFPTPRPNGCHPMTAMPHLSSLTIATFAILVIAVTGCGQTRQERINAYDAEELRYLRQYQTGDIQNAKQALLSYQHLINEEENAGLHIPEKGWTSALISTRLALIYRHLGDTNMETRQLDEAIIYAKADAQTQGNHSLTGKTDEELRAWLIEVVDKLDDNTKPKWKN
jgi:hypothetical protein